MYLILFLFYFLQTRQIKLNWLFAQQYETHCYKSSCSFNGMTGSRVNGRSFTSWVLLQELMESPVSTERRKEGSCACLE